jgi:transcriptional regulator with XRE-family HTH domain
MLTGMGPTGADLIREARKRAGLTQRELAERAGSTQSSVARWESARSEPSFANVVRLLRLCGFVLDVRLELYDDGLRDDWAQAQAALRRTPDELIESDRRLHAFFRDGQRSMAAALAASAADG